MTTSDTSDDPFADHFRRDPLPEAGIRVIFLTDLPAESADAIVAPLVDMIAALGRQVEHRIISIQEAGLGRALERGLQGATLPLVLVTTAEEPWEKRHLQPLLEAIDQCDHVIGCRPEKSRGNWAGWLRVLARRLIFAVPLRDVHSPCRLHRLEKLAAIPLQSASSFLETEILAKATFLGHLIDEVAIPRLGGGAESTGWWSDLNQVLVHPRFVRSSSPPEETQGQGEGGDGPCGEDQHGHTHIEQAGPLEHHQAQGADQLGERQDLNKGLGGGGKPIGREEDTGKEPHRQHDQVHQPADRLGGTGTARDEQTDPRERECAQHVDSNDQSQAAADGHLEHERSQQKQEREVRDDKREPSRQECEQEITPGHRRGGEPLEQFGDAEIDQQKSDAPEAAPHGVEADQSRNQEVDVT